MGEELTSLQQCPQRGVLLSALVLAAVGLVGTALLPAAGAHCRQRLFVFRRHLIVGQHETLAIVNNGRTSHGRMVHIIGGPGIGVSPSRGRRQLNLPARMLTGKDRQVGKDRQAGRATKRQVPRECWRYPAAESRGQGWKLVAARPAPCHPETPSPAASCSPAPTALMPASARPTSFRACAWLLCQNACILQRGRQARLLWR